MEHDSEAANGPPSATVGRVTAVLDAFLAGQRDLGVSELAASLGLAKSVVHRLVTALSEAEYLTHIAETRRYGLGPKVVRLGLVALGQTNIRQRAIPLLRELAAESGETATLSLLVGDHRVYAEQVESAQAVRQSVPIGQAAALYLGGSGKAILAYLPLARQTDLLTQATTANSHLASGQGIDPSALRLELEAIRERGFAISASERVLGATSAAAPVFDDTGSVVASVSVAGVTVRHGLKQMAAFGPLARRCADKLSAELGWSGKR